MMRFFNVRLRTYAQYASMNEFTCSEHSVHIRTVSRKNAALEINTMRRKTRHGRTYVHLTSQCPLSSPVPSLDAHNTSHWGTCQVIGIAFDTLPSIRRCRSYRTINSKKYQMYFLSTQRGEEVKNLTTRGKLLSLTILINPDKILRK